MKHYKIFSWLLWPLTLSGAESVANLNENTFEFRIRETGSNVYPWMKGDKAFGGLLKSRFFEPSYIALVKLEPGDSILILQGNLPLVAEVLRRSLGDKSVDLGFIRDNVARFLLATMAPAQSEIMDEEYLRGYRMMATMRPLAEQFRGDPATLKLIENLCEGVRATIEAGRWKLTMNVINSRGGAFRWEAAGATQPFAVERFDTRILHQNGTLQPLK